MTNALREETCIELSTNLRNKYNNDRSGDNLKHLKGRGRNA